MVDGEKVHPDWIELHNPDSQGSFSLEGRYLTDGRPEPVGYESRLAVQFI